jgi:hypothetical protein
VDVVRIEQALTPCGTTAQSTLLYDDFEPYPVAVWPEGGTVGNWLALYGRQGIEGVPGARRHYLEPPPSISPGETHAALTVSDRVFSGDIEYRVVVNTQRQLRQGTPPNPWEVGWVIWNYQGAAQFYYFIVKPNGFELGKADDTGANPSGPACSWPEYVNCKYPGAQRYLRTGSTPTFPIGVDYAIVIRQVGATITASVDGTQLATFTDTDNVLTWGRVGHYAEDARALYGSSVVRPARPSQ